MTIKILVDGEVIGEVDRVIPTREIQPNDIPEIEKIPGRVKFAKIRLTKAFKQGFEK